MQPQLSLHLHVTLALLSSAAVSLLFPSFTKWQRETAAVHPRLSQHVGAGHGAPRKTPMAASHDGGSGSR